ncbi:type II secretion system protein N [Pseudomonas sp.]|uniref:type II secretion system protein N n=1 Tax=Pseudomonas sp. TaxID=306 RepID=UPI0037C78FE5
MSPTHLTRLPAALCLLLLLAGSLSLSYQGAAFWRLLAQPVTTATPIKHAAEPTLNLQQLADLFGQPMPANNGPAPATALNLKLMAVFTHPHSNRSSAVIAQTGDTPRRFKVGDSISQGVTLASVERLHVTLLRDGRRESLHFPEKAASAQQNEWARLPHGVNQLNSNP